MRAYNALQKGKTFPRLFSTLSLSQLLPPLRRFPNGFPTPRRLAEMNPDRLKQLQANVRIGGKGTPRRKVKKVQKVATTDDKKLQSTLKKLNVSPISGIEEVNMFQADGNVLHFAAPQ
ncbi:MAG: hypothetical protein BJ554DRAFT_4073, partial [Olpidium bornovanus]